MRLLPSLLGAVLGIVLVTGPVAAQDGATRFVRYEYNGAVSYGILEDGAVHQLSGDLFGAHQRTGSTAPLSEVQLLAPVEPSKVIAVGLNYLSHIGDREPAEYPGLFSKFPTSIVGPGDAIVKPADSENLHYEGEVVIVIGRRAENVSVSEAAGYIFGVTAGNDVSERGWQFSDLQWFRGKASDTFGPIGPVIAQGIDYGNLDIETRLNGEVRQSANTSDLIFDFPTIVSYVSQYVTLLPGDVIFTGTPGETAAMVDGDVVEIEIEGVGVLRNHVVAEQAGAQSMRD